MSFHSPLTTGSRLLIGGMILLIRLYQVSLSPFIGGQCRYRPTCSRYFIDALNKRGFFRGSAMGIWRIMRCNPLGPGGYDPVE